MIQGAAGALARATSAGATGHFNRIGQHRLPRRPRRLRETHSQAVPAKSSQSFSGIVATDSTSTQRPNHHEPEIEQSGPVSQDDDDDSEPTFAPARTSRLSAPQLQVQLSLLPDRTRLRRLENTLHAKGAWQQVTRMEDFCHTHVSHKWLYHIDACAGSVLAPHDYITNVQKKLGNRSYTCLANAVCVVPS